MKGTEVPIIPSVLSWAIKESGLDSQAIARTAGVDSEILKSWLDGRSRPKLSQFKKLAAAVRRPCAALLLPAPPESDRALVSFRRPVDSDRDSLNPEELRYLREVRRIQAALSWATRELGAPPARLTRAEKGVSTEAAASRAREQLGVHPEHQHSWPNASHAMKGWRDALERLGVLVFVLPMGRGSCRGFSLDDQHAPTIAVNSWWNEEARIFSLMHELGHLLTATDSACDPLDRRSLTEGPDRLERWCERFAADLLLPWDAVRVAISRLLGWRPRESITDFEDVRKIARYFRTSVSATAIRLIERGIADWSLYEQILKSFDDKSSGGGGGGRTRGKRRMDEYGTRVASLFVAAMHEEVFSRDDVLSFLRVADSELERYESVVVSR